MTSVRNTQIEMAQLRQPTVRALPPAPDLKPQPCLLERTSRPGYPGLRLSSLSEGRAPP